MYNEYILSLKAYITQYAGLLTIVLIGVLIYILIKKKRNELSKQNKLFVITVIVLTTVLCSLHIVPATIDICTISESIETVEFVSAYRQSRNTTYSQNDDLFGTAVTVELNDGTTLFLTASDYFPNNVENSSLKYAVHSGIIVSYDTD